jgi:thiamine pyrophosphate-dependent acetolactate synthase large subunit-like protein
MQRDFCAGLIRKYLSDEALVYCSLGSTGRTWRAQNAPQITYYGSDPMGIAVSMALGLALAQPRRQVLMLGGDGDFVMNLGSLLTVVGSRVTNMKMIIFDNGRYETGGGIPLPGSGAYSFAAMARGAGFPYGVDVADSDKADAAIKEFFAQPGLAFLAASINQEASPYPPAPALAQVEERAIFMQRLAASNAKH